MNINVLLWLLLALNFGMIIWGLIDPRRVYRFYFLAAGAFAGFAIPQLIGLSNNSGVLPIPQEIFLENGLDLLMLVCCFCLLALWFGDNMGSSRPGKSPIVAFEQYDCDRLKRVAIGLTVFGVIITQIGANVLDPEYLASLGNQWTGPITILMFFQSMQKYGFALSVLLYFKTRSSTMFLCAFFNTLTNFISFLVVARRGAAADTMFIAILGAYYGRGLRLPTWALAALFLAGTLWSNAIGAFRGQADLSFIEKIESAQLWDTFQYTLDNGGFEMGNAAVQCWCADFMDQYDFGSIHWNQFIHAYFPGQIFGSDVKKSIKFTDVDLPREVLGYRAPPGTTMTGMSDAFCSFGYFGAVKFYIIGFVMGRWFVRGGRGDLRAQLTYMALMASALHTITHGTYWLFNNYVHMVIFAFPALYWAKRGVDPHNIETHFNRPVAT